MHLFSVAVLAVKNVTLSAAEYSNPPAPLLFSLFVSLQRLSANPNESANTVNMAAVGMIQPSLPAGYVVANIAIRPVPVDEILRVAAIAASDSPFNTSPPSAAVYGIEPYYDEKTDEAAFNTLRPGTDDGNRSPRYALRCPYCGSQSLRFTESGEIRTPDGYRVEVSFDDEEGSPVRFSGPEGTLESGFYGFTGTAFGVTCRNSHRSRLRFVEDEREEHGRALFLVFEYGESPLTWLYPESPGGGSYPVRT
jgi:hypothetical protein